MEKQGSILKEKKLNEQQMQQKFAKITFNTIWQNKKTCIYIYIYIYIYIKHIHWLKLIKSRSKWPDSIRKCITSLRMSSFKEIVFFDE